MFTFIALLAVMQYSIKCKLVQNKNLLKNRRVLTQKASALKELIVTSSSRMRLAVFNAKEQKNENFLMAWENGEQGSTINILNAYKELFELHENDENQQIPLYQFKLSLKVLYEIRRHFTKQQGNYQDQRYYNVKQDVTEINGDRSAFFRIGEESSLIEKLQIHIDDLENRLGEVEKADLEKTQSHRPLQPYTVVYRNSEQAAYIHSQKQASKERKTEWINKLFDTYENVSLPQLGNIRENQDEYLKVLALLITDLERIHPYMDFNCRTFAVILLNKELIRHDLTPSIMEDPNDFDFMNTEESVEQIKIGQRNYNKLQIYGKIHDEDPDDKQLIKKVRSWSHFRYLFCQKQNSQQSQHLQYINFKLFQMFKKRYDKMNLQEITLEKLKKLAKKVIEKEKDFRFLKQIFFNTETYQLVEEKIMAQLQCEDGEIEIEDVQQFQLQFNEANDLLNSENLIYLPESKINKRSLLI